MNYLLVGPENYLKQEFLQKLKKSVLSTDENLKLNFEVFDGGSVKFAEILTFLNTLPFASEKKLILINDIDSFSSEEKKLILKYLKSPDESTVLVLESSSGGFSEFLGEISKFTKAIKYNRLSKSELGLWIRKEFAAHKKEIPVTLANTIAELVGNDLSLLKNEIEKIVSFAGEAREITENHIERISGKSDYKTAFELIDLVLAKRVDKALAFLEGLLLKEKPHQILNLLAWQFRNFMKIKNLPEGTPSQGISRLVGIRQHFVNKTLEQARRYTRPEIERNLEVILEADFFIKRGRLQPQHALERALLYLCGSVSV